MNNFREVSRATVGVHCLKKQDSLFFKINEINIDIILLSGLQALVRFLPSVLIMFCSKRQVFFSGLDSLPSPCDI